MIRSSTRLWLSLLVWPAALVAAAGSAAGEPRGVPSVIDGDTIKLEGEAIRLYGIDAPELGQNCTVKGRIYDCGMVARSALLDLTAGATVTCEIIAGQPGGDGAEGKPGRCFAAGYDLSEGMAYTGWALADRLVSKRYVEHEDGARQARRGLWKGTFVAPWDWRGGKRLPEESGTE
ncbi:MAG: thermonuclease family protein [Kiloniellaceae bacterium]